MKRLILIIFAFLPLFVFSQSNQGQNIIINKMKLNGMIYSEKMALGSTDTLIVVNADSTGYRYLNVADPVDSLDAVNLKYFLNNAASKDSIFLTLTTDTLFIGGDTITSAISGNGSMDSLSLNAGFIVYYLNDSPIDSFSLDSRYLQTLSISNDTIFLTNGGYVKIPASGLSGSGTDNRIPRFNGTAALENSGIADSSDAVAITIKSNEYVGINKSAPTARLHVGGDVKIDTNLQLGSDASGFSFPYVRNGSDNQTFSINSSGIISQVSFPSSYFTQADGKIYPTAITDKFGVGAVPSYMFSVKDSTASTYAASIVNAHANSSGLLLKSGSAVSGGYPLVVQTAAGNSLLTVSSDYQTTVQGQLNINTSDVHIGRSTDNMTFTDGTVGTLTLYQLTQLGGDVSKVGTPANNQVGVWTGDGTIEGATNFTYDGTDMLVTGGNIRSSGTGTYAELDRRGQSTITADGDTWYVDVATSLNAAQLYVNSAVKFAVDTVGNLTTTGKITAPATSTSFASFNMPHGTAPSSPVNGDLWTTSTAPYVRINGTTHNLLTGTSSSGQFLVNSSGTMAGSAGMYYDPTSATLQIEGANYGLSTVTNSSEIITVGHYFDTNEYDESLFVGYRADGYAKDAIHFNTEDGNYSTGSGVLKAWTISATSVTNAIVSFALAENTCMSGTLSILAYNTTDDTYTQCIYNIFLNNIASWTATSSLIDRIGDAAENTIGLGMSGSGTTASVYLSNLQAGHNYKVTYNFNGAFVNN